jgi:hypothetical protein
MAVQDWEAIGKEKRAQAAEKIPKAWRLDAKYTANISETASNNVLGVPGECGLLTSKQLDITENYDATALLEKLHSGAFSAFEVTEAFCIRAAIAQQVVRLGRIHLHTYTRGADYVRQIALRKLSSSRHWSALDTWMKYLRRRGNVQAHFMVFQSA